MEDPVANARTDRAGPVLSTIWRGVVYLSHCNRLGDMSVLWFASRSDGASRRLLSLFGLTISYFRRHKRVTATVQQQVTFNRDLSAGALIEIRSRMLEIRENPLRVPHEVLHTETNATLAGSRLTEAQPDSSTRKSCPLPSEIQRRSPRYDASTVPRALEFALPGQW